MSKVRTTASERLVDALPLDNHFGLVMLGLPVIEFLYIWLTN